MHTDLIAHAGKTVDRVTDRDARRGAEPLADGPAAFADMLGADPVTPAAARDTRDADAEPADRPKADAAADRQDERKPADTALSESSDQATAEREAHRPTEGSTNRPAATGSEAAGAGLPAATEAKPLGPSASFSVPPVSAPAAPAVPSPAAGSLPGATPGVDPGVADGLAAPPSAQAADLARVLATGTRVSVTQTTSAAQAIVPPLGGESIVVLASGGETRSTNGTAQRVQAPGSAPLVAAVTSEPGASSLAEALKSASLGIPGSVDSGQNPGSGKAAELTSGVAAAPPQGAAALSPAASPSTSSIASPPAATQASSVLASAAGDAATTASKHKSGDASAGGVQPSDPLAAGHHTPIPAASAQATPVATLRPLASEPAGPPPSAPDQVSVHIARAVQSGVDRIEIQLSPAALGRVEVRLDIADHHHVKVAISADTPDALDALRADGRLLERALHEAGLKTEPGSLSFHLRDPGSRPGSGGGHQAHDDGQPSAHRSGVAALETDPIPPSPPPSMGRRSGGIDIRA